MSRSARICVFALLLSPAAFAQQAEGGLYKEEGQWLQRNADGQTYLVDTEVISLRWRAPIVSLEQLGLHLTAEGSPLAQLVADLSVLRTNRLGISDLHLDAGQDPVQMTRALEATGLFRFVTVNTQGRWVETPDDPLYPQQYALNNTGQGGGTVGADIGAEAAWDIQTGDPSVLIAVLDSGTDIFHPDLAPNRYENLADPINGVDDDGNGFIDDFYGWDFDGNDNDVVTSTSHGTLVAGVVAARTDNGIGVAGVAGGIGANNGCTIIPCPVGAAAPNGAVLDDAIIYAADKGVRIITLSLSVGSSPAIDAAVDYAVNGNGVWINAASGNSGGTNNVGYPARLADIVAIGSTGNTGLVSGFSSGGPQVWVCAPGENILSTNLGNGYTAASGTSFSSPCIAGIAGLMFSANPALTPSEVAQIMKDTAIDIGASGFDLRTGWGRVDAAAAVAEAAGTAGCVINTFCNSVANSTGFAATMSSSGNASVTANNLVLTTSLCPSGQNGLYFYGPGEQQTPFGPGFLCVAGPLHRLSVIATDALGVATWNLDISMPPAPSGQITAGSTWSFQFWFRDPAGGGSGFNTSNGLTATFCP
ncbi:MAG: subtilisin family serine protease [Planctomycetota bacterium]|jgi:subtilisin family serine protease